MCGVVKLMDARVPNDPNFNQDHFQRQFQIDTSVHQDKENTMSRRGASSENAENASLMIKLSQYIWRVFDKRQIKLYKTGQIWNIS